MSSENDAFVPEVQEVLHGRRGSAARRYALVVLGEASWGRLLLYELLTSLLGSCPGALGLLLRGKLYRPLFRSLGRGVMIGRNVTFRGPSRISLGDGVCIDDNVVIDARGPQAHVSIGAGAFIGRNTVVRCRGQSLSIGEESDIGCHCLVATDSQLEIGRDVLLAAYTYIAAGGLRRYADKTRPIKTQGFDSKGGVRIGDGCWIGAFTIVMDGVVIGPGTVIGAHSMVNKPIPEMAVAWGVPATVQKMR